MSRAARKAKRRRRADETLKANLGDAVAEIFRQRFASPDQRSNDQFLADMRAKQAAGKLANPATAALLDRLELSLHGARNRR